MKYLALVVSFLPTNVFADPLFHVDEGRLAGVARKAILAGKPELQDHNLPITTMILICDPNTGKSCTAMVEVEISASAPMTTRNGDICIAQVDYTSIQVHVKPDGETIIANDQGSSGTRSAVEPCDDDSRTY